MKLRQRPLIRGAHRLGWALGWWLALATGRPAAYQPTPPPAPPLVVTGAVADVNGLTITGRHFGSSPFVTLDLVPLAVRRASDTQLAVEAPVSVMPAGDYLLTVSRGPSPTDTGSFQLALGAAERPRGGAVRATPVPAGAAQLVSPNAGDATAAQVGDRRIGLAEVDREWLRSDPASYIGLSRQLYDIRRGIVDRLVTAELLAREAAARGLTPEALLREEIPKRTIPLPDTAVLALYQGLGDSARGASLEQMRPALRAWLEKITQPELAKMTYVEELMKVSTRAERFLVAPRVQVARAAQDARVGPATAPIELVAFGDFQSPEYARLAQAFGRVRETFGDRLRLVVKQLPLLGAESVAAAEAGLCALAQARFWAFHDALVSEPGAAGPLRRRELATVAGLDRDRFDACVDAGEFRGVIREALEEARRYGLTTSPSVLINGRLAPDSPPFLPAFDYLKRLIEEELGEQARAAARPGG